MTAKMKHGHGAHPRAHGSDEGSAHERLNRLHAQPGRPEGAMHTAAPPMQPQMPAPAGPNPGMAPPAPGAPMGMGAPDDDEGDDT